MPEIPEGMVPGCYKGFGTGLREGVRYHNADGTPKQNLSLEPGDEMLWADEDVYGKTLWHDPNQNARSKYIGLGRCVMTGDEGKSERELIDLGYEFHDPRPDLEPLEPLEQFLRRKEQKEKTPKKKGPKDLPQTITIEQPLEDIPAQEESEQL